MVVILGPGVYNEIINCFSGGQECPPELRTEVERFCDSPIQLSKLEGALQWLQHRVTCFLVPPNSPSRICAIDGLFAQLRSDLEHLIVPLPREVLPLKCQNLAPRGAEIIMQPPRSEEDLALEGVTECNAELCRQFFATRPDAMLSLQRFDESIDKAVLQGIDFKRFSSWLVHILYLSKEYLDPEKSFSFHVQSLFARPEAISAFLDLAYVQCLEICLRRLSASYPHCSSLLQILVEKEMKLGVTNALKQIYQIARPYGVKLMERNDYKLIVRDSLQGLSIQPQHFIKHLLGISNVSYAH